MHDVCPVQEMFAFPVLQHVFCAMADQGGYSIDCNRPVKRVTRCNGGVEVEDERGIKVGVAVLEWGGCITQSQGNGREVVRVASYLGM